MKRKASKLKDQKETELEEAFEFKMNKLANDSELNHDGGNDVRLFYDNERITVYASDMTRKEYKAMEKSINSYHVKKPGFEVYCWNDCSGYDYWKRDRQDSNYIMVTANIIDINKVKIEELKSEMRKAFDKMYCDYDNHETHDYSKKD